MPSTVGTPGYIGQVQKMDKTTAADGTLFDAIHQQLLNNDAFLNSEIISTLQKAVNSGVTDFSPIVAGLTSNLNAFKFGKGAALVNGILNSLTNYGGMTDGSNLVQLDAPPAANVTPSLPGSARDDLVFLEMYLDTTGAPKWRIRVVDGVNFATYPEGINHSSLVKAQGGQAIPTIYTFTKSTTDNGMYVAGTGSNADQTGLATLDGFVYAIPLFRVRRRNNAGFDPDSNPLGAKQYYSYGINAVNTSTWVLGGTYECSTTTTALMNAGDQLYTVTGIYIGKVVSIDSATTFSLQNMWLSQSVTVGQIISGGAHPASDRQDGLYSNIIDSSDITDLRHQVSLTGFNYQSLLEKNLDLLLHGQLTTKENTRYGRDYIGLNVAAGMPDDANTLLRLVFNGSMVGTANGSQVTNSKQGSGTEAYRNGIQGLAADFSGASIYCEQYPVSIGATGSIELAFKAPSSAPSTSSALLAGFGDNTATIRKFTLSLSNVGAVGFSYYNDSGVFVANLVSQNGLIQFGDPSWHLVRVTFNSSGMTLYVDGVQVATTATATTWTTVSNVVVGSGSDGVTFTAYAFKGLIDIVRISNIVRADSLSPTNFSYGNGDRIIDGPNGDFNQWSDDLGGVAGVNGRTNPYGLSRVPNFMAGRVSVNGQEIRHYYGNGATPGWSVPSIASGSAPTGSFDGSNEIIAVTANELADGTRTMFTFNKPTNASGIFVNANNVSAFYYLSTINAGISSASIDGTEKLTLVYSTAPSSGSIVQANYRTAIRHAHLIPSTKGFTIHDWVDDQINAGTNPPTTYQTIKYNVISLNHVRVTPNGNTDGAIQNGDYTVSGLNARSTLSAAVASGATTLSIANGANFVNGQNIRISKGDGTWYTTTVSSVSGNTITVPATTVDLAQNAVIEGTAIVTFTIAPVASSIVDIVYESVYTPALGDYIRVMYQYTPYQGAIAAGDQYTILAENNALVTSLGTGPVNTGVYSGNAGMTGATVNLPTPVPDYMLKNDAFIGTSRSSVAAKQLIQSQWDDVPASNSWNYHVKRVGGQSSPNTSYGALRGITSLNMNNSGGVEYLYTEQISASVPTKSILAQLIKDQNGLLKLLVYVRQQSTNQPQIDYGAGSNTAVDVFHIQGRPLIKNYGGVAA